MLTSSVVDRGFEPRSISLFVFTDCWHQESHQRPTFTEILSRLEDIAASPFMTTPQESFQTMQEDWRLEIEAITLLNLFCLSFILQEEKQSFLKI
jgi:hypothetical protein